MTQTRLKQLREEAVLTVHELAEASGVSDDTISKNENGQRVARPSTLRKLAKVLVVSPQELRKPAAAEEVALAGKVEAPREAGPPDDYAAAVSLSQWFEARCGHSFLALSKDELQERFDALAEDGPERRELGLKINNEFNEFCAFPRNVTTQERLSMRKMIRDSISAVAVKHQLALFESGLYPEYAEELSRVFDLERTLDADEASA